MVVKLHRLARQRPVERIQSAIFIKRQPRSNFATRGWKTSVAVGDLKAAIARYLGNDRDADDVCQEVMLKVLYGLKNFEGKSKFKTWLYSITYNECITQYRKERRKRRLMDALSLDPLEEASEEKAPKPEEKGGLDKWLVHVNPIDREILVLRFVAELEFQEIADIMHMGLSATKMRYKRALDRLREKFSDSPET